MSAQDKMYCDIYQKSVKDILLIHFGLDTCHINTKSSQKSQMSACYYIHVLQCMFIMIRITKNYEFKKGVSIDSTIKSTETRILLLQFSLFQQIQQSLGPL